MKIITEITQLQGESLTEVCFVTDYIQLGFSGALLACIAHPTVKTPRGEWQFPATGARDEFCSLIGKEVSGVVVHEDKSIVLYFGDSTVIVPLDQENRRFGEAANFTPGFNQPIQVY